MRSGSRQISSRPAPLRTITELRDRLAEAEEALRAIRTGEVDAVVVTGKRSARVFTLEGAERAYRVLMESMNEGGLTLASDATVLYANRCFARMVKCPLEQVIGSSFVRFLSPESLQSHRFEFYAHLSSARQHAGLILESCIER